MTRLVAVPNVSEGRDEAALDAIGAAFARHADVLHRSADADHHRAVFFLAGEPGELHRALAAGAAEAAARIDLRAPRRAAPARRRARRRAGRLPRRRRERGAAIAEALLRRRRDRRGGHPRLPLRRARPAGARAPSCAGAARRASRARGTRARLRPARQLHPTAGATLVAARPPLIAFNLELAPPATLADARAIAARSARAGRRGCPACARSACTWSAGTSSRSRPTSRTTARSRAADVLAAVRAPPRRSARPSSSRPRPRPRSPAGPTDVELRMPASIEALLGALTSQAHGPDQAQAPDQAPRQRRRHDRGARPHRPQADRRRAAQAAPAATRARSGATPSRRGAAPPPRAGLASVMLFVLFQLGIAGSDQTIATAIALVARRVPDLRAARLLDRPLLLGAPDAQGRPPAAAARPASAEHGRPHLHRRAGAGELPHRPPRRRARGDRDRPRRRGRRGCSRRSTRSASRSRRSCSPTRTSTTSAPSRRSRARPARRSGAPSSRCPVLADIMRYVPWPGFGPFESYDADHTVAGGERCELAGLDIDVLFTPGHSPGPRDLLDPRRAGRLLRRRAVPGLDRPHRPAGRRPRDADAHARRRCRVAARTRPSCTRATWASPRSAASAPRNPFLAQLA